MFSAAFSKKMSQLYNIKYLLCSKTITINFYNRGIKVNGSLMAHTTMQTLRNSTLVTKKLNSVSLRQLPVAITAGLHVGDSLLIQRVGPAGEVVLQGCETVLSHEEVHEFIHVRLR